MLFVLKLLPLFFFAFASARFSLHRHIPSYSKTNKISFDDYQPRYDPYLDHAENVYLADGAEVVIQGTLGLRRSDIELRCASGSMCIPFHISIRPDEKAFIFNARFPTANWDIEERRFFYLEKSTHVKISIMVTSSSYKITINDFWTKTFDHRMDHKLIAILKVYGDFGLESTKVLDIPNEEEEEKEEELAREAEEDD